VPPRQAIIIGGGPAGLTAAYELATRSDIRPVVLEKCDILGGISRTANYKGNRIDIGGHRFFSKSDRVMEWWLAMMPLQDMPAGSHTITYQNKSRPIDVAPGGLSPDSTDTVMLVRERKSRIYSFRKFFDYPIKLTPDTLMKLGAVRTMRIGMSYMKAMALPIKPEKNLEDFFINRFGKELYLTFFKDYTEKVWGTECRNISAEWGAQRIKGLSITKAITHFLSTLVKKKSSDIGQKGVETSLIEQFMYPKLGPGQMWEETAKKVQQHGGEVTMGWKVVKIRHENGRVTSIDTRHVETGEVRTLEGEYFFSTMPVRELMRALDPAPPADVLAVSDGLLYRDFMTVGILLDKLKVYDETPEGRKLIKDNWIYIQEPDVEVGRLQIFNNWSPYLVADQSKVWVGMEYFTNEADALWNKEEEAMKKFGVEELSKIGIIEAGDVLDTYLLKMPKAYPGYFGTYGQFPVVRAYLDTLVNLFPVGRNGMHRYNNQDHSMLTAMQSVDNILAGVTDKSNIWDINTEEEYHEEKTESVPKKEPAKV
jgi:protoporphyrinogen oxidase